jgi:hypothetical protein
MNRTERHNALMRNAFAQPVKHFARFEADGDGLIAA